MADDVAALGFSIDSSPLTRASNELDRLATSSQKLVPAQTLAATSTQRMAREQQIATTHSRAMAVTGAELADVIELNNVAQNRAHNSLSTRSFFRLLAREASLVGGPLASVIQQLGVLTVGGQRIGPGIVAATIAFAGLVAVLTQVVKVLIDTQTQQSKVQNALALMGGTANFTGGEFETMVRKMAESGELSRDSIREAQLELLKFKDVGKSSFETVLIAAGQLSKTGLVDMKAATKAIAEALKDPANANQALEEVQISLTATQRKQVDEFLRAGKVFEAQSVILDRVKEKTANLNEGIDDLKTTWNQFMEFLNRQIDVLDSKRRKPSLGPAPALTGDSFGDRFGAATSDAGVNATAANMAKFKKSVDDTTEALRVQGLTAGKNAIEMDIYNQTVAKGIPLNTAAGQAIASQVKAIASANDFRAITDGLKNQAAAAKIATDVVGMSIGASTAYTIVETEKQKAIIKGLPLTDEQIKKVQALAAAIGNSTQATAQKTAQSNADFERQTVFMSDIDKQIAQVQRQIHNNDWEKFMNDGLAATMRITDALNFMKTSMDQFAQSVVTGFLNGKNGADALRDAANQLAQTLAKKGVENLISGALSGDPIQAAIGGLEVAGAFLIKSFTGQSEAAKKAAEELEKAKAAWEKMRQEVEDFNAASHGMQIGDVTQKIREAGDEWLKVWNAADLAHNTAGMQQANEAYVRILARLRNEFAESFNGIVDALGSGLGFDSPFVKATQNVQNFSDQISKFVTDTQTVFSGASVAFGGSFTPLAGAGNAASQIAQAQEAGRKFLLSLLTGVQPLSDVATKILEINGTAAALRGALIDLGASADEATKAIAEGVVVAMDNLRKSFTDTLQREINEATGQGFVNNFLDLFKKVDEARADAVLLGTGTGLVDRFFAVQAQKIVDDAGLVGTAFDDLIKQFPQLTGVVHESTQAIKAAQDEINQIARNIVDYVNQLKTGSDSPLSPSGRLSAATAAYNSQLALAQGGNVSAQSTITKYADELLKASKDFSGSSAAFQTLFQNVTAQLLALPAVTGSTDPVVVALNDVLTAQNTGNVALAQIQSSTAAQVTLQNSANTLQTTANTLVTATNNSLTTANSTLAAIQTLNNTQIATLNLLNSQFTAVGPAASVRQLSFNQDNIANPTTSSTIIGALQKIVANTYATALNTSVNAAAATGRNVSGFSFYQPNPSAFAEGGTIPPFGEALVSEHSPSGGRFLRAGSKPIQVFPGSPAANDNAALLAEMRGLRYLVAELIEVNSRGHAGTAMKVQDLEVAERQSASRPQQPGRKRRAS